jgi:hypothetical protein
MNKTNILLAILILVLLLCIIMTRERQNKQQDNREDYYYLRQAKRGKIILPPKGDYKKLYGDALMLIQSNVPIRESIRISFTKNRPESQRKLNRMSTVLMRYMNIEDRDPELIREILSAIILLEPEERQQLLDIITNPEKYLPNDCNNQDESINKFVEVYGTHFVLKKNAMNEIKKYAKNDTWLIQPATQSEKHNKVVKYFWIVMKVILAVPEVFACNVLRDKNRYTSSLQELSALILYSDVVDKKNLYILN